MIDVHEVVLRADHVTKRYRLGSERSNWRALIPGGWGEPTTDRHFDALSDVSLVVRRGQSIGIIGGNGAGKSTLLKVLAGVVRPTSGEVEISGRVGAVIELGVGFNPDLTGADNVRFGASLLGATPEELDERYEDIVAFAGLEGFMDMPLKRYSTGMAARLGFSLITAFECDVLLLDEVLAVGDWSFQQQCIERVRSLHEAGTALVVVAHNNWLITQMCDQAILLEHGRVAASGDPLAVIERYLGPEATTDSTKDPNLPVLPTLDAPPEDSPVRLTELRLEPSVIQPNQRLSFEAELEIDRPVDASLVLSIYTMGRAVFADREEGPSEILREPGRWVVRGTTAPLPFSSGLFEVRVAVVEGFDRDDFLQEHLGALTTATASMRVAGPASTRPGLAIDIEWAAQRRP